MNELAISPAEMAELKRLIARKKHRPNRLLGVPVGDFITARQRTIHVVSDGAEWWVSTITGKKIERLNDIVFPS